MQCPSWRTLAAPRSGYPTGLQAAGGSTDDQLPILLAWARRARARAAALPGPRAQPPTATLLCRAGRLHPLSSCCSGCGRPPWSAFGRAGAASPSPLAGAASSQPPRCAWRKCRRRCSASNLSPVAQRGGPNGAGRGAPQARATGPGGAGPQPEPAAAWANLPAAPGRSPRRRRRARTRRGRPLQG
ncbi:translation initiation factor IF-2-like [Onychomys torridus]|uniref:translation initiation factor IF-2-like n=1 Tax=Onychomys torridus TaxID=38674 RepID=UPI00167F93EA|nr:translation initiation factor IF-2-like [Onychomys torridus]